MDAPTANAFFSGFFDCSFCDACADIEEARVVLLTLKRLENKARLVRTSILACYFLQDQIAVYINSITFLILNVLNFLGLLLYFLTLDEPRI